MNTISNRNKSNEDEFCAPEPNMWGRGGGGTITHPMFIPVLKTFFALTLLWHKEALKHCLNSRSSKKLIFSVGIGMNSQVFRAIDFNLH